MALCGIPAYRADASSCTITIPATALISLSPSVPSDPLPDRITPMARSLRSRASERKK